MAALDPLYNSCIKEEFKKGKSKVRRIWQLWTPFRTAVNCFWIKRRIRLQLTPSTIAVNVFGKIEMNSEEYGYDRPPRR